VTESSITDGHKPLSPTPAWAGRLGDPRRLRRQGIIALVVLGPVLAVATAVVLGSGVSDRGVGLLRVVLLLDLCYLIALIALIGWQVGSVVMARRRRSAGSKLHLRLTGVFALVAMVPTVIVAVFATLSVNFGIEAWFSDRVGGVVRNSLSVAQAYEQEHRATIVSDALRMANDLNRAAGQGITGLQLTEFVRQQAAVRELPEAFVFNSDREIIARGEFSYLFSFEPPNPDQLARAREGEVVIMQDELNNEIRALVHLTNFFDAFLYVTRDVQGDVLRLLDETQATVQFYEQLERDRDKLLFDFALIYLGFALLVIVAAVLLGLWFAERLSRPVGRLAHAAERIGAGDLAIRVKEEQGDDEIALLSRTFNRMAGEVQGQRDALIAARDQTERRRHFIEAVLSGVTAGVIGVDGAGRVELVNAAGAEILGRDRAQLMNRPLTEALPDFEALMERAERTPGGVARGEVRIPIGGETREFLARFAPKDPESLAEGHVLTFDDITALGAAQRRAAWGDVARRIAHEIKNPLTPIQLSADRLRRKFSAKLGAESGDVDQIIDVITRQTGEIRRMVDEFARFARMPEPKMVMLDLREPVALALALQRSAHGEIDYNLEQPDAPVMVEADAGLIGQCLTNILQNAADAIEARGEAGATAARRIGLTLVEDPHSVRVTIRDTGIGLPKQDRARLADPYVTTRKKGTGLGLAIVSKIAEQHGGGLSLADAGGAEGYDGAEIVLSLPRPAPGGTPHPPAESQGELEKP